jgi:hypothetical protein
MPMDPRMGQALQQKLQELMQDPVARAGMQAHMQGGDPRQVGAQLAMQGMQGGGGGINRPSGAMTGPRGQEVIRGGNAPLNPYARDTGELAAGPQGGRSSPASDGELYELGEANQGVRGNLPLLREDGDMTGYGDEMETMPDPRQTPMPLRPGEEQDMVSKEIDRKGATYDGVDAPTQNDIERLTQNPSQTAIEAFNLKFGEDAADKYLGDGASEYSPVYKQNQGKGPPSDSGSDDGDGDDDHEYR